MWRFYYTIGRNLFRLPKIISTMRHKAAHPEAYPEEDCYAYMQYVCKLMQRTGHVRTETYGTENLPKEGGYMLYPNHQGKYDAYGIISAHARPCTFVMDVEKSRGLFINEIVDMLKGKRLQIDNPRQGLTIINEIAQEVAAGRRYILFPEGGYARDQRNTLGEFKSGCFKIPLKTRTPIVPVAIIDSYKVYNSMQLSPVTTQVHFLKPIPYEEYQGLRTPQIAAMVKERIQQKIHEIEHAQAIAV